MRALFQVKLDSDGACKNEDFAVFNSIKLTSELLNADKGVPCRIDAGEG